MKNWMNCFFKILARRILRGNLQDLLCTPIVITIKLSLKGRGHYCSILHHVMRRIEFTIFGIPRDNNCFVLDLSQLFVLGIQTSLRRNKNWAF